MSIQDTFDAPNDIVDLEYYKSKYSLPKTSDEANRDIQLTKLIQQCLDQVNVLCAGRPYREWSKLDDTKDGERKYWLRKAVCAYIEYCIDTAHIFVNKQFQSSGTIPFSLNASANDANFENVRHDIIKLLKQGNWYQTLYGTDNLKSNCAFDKIDHNNYLSNLTSYLKTIFKTLNNENQFTNGLILSNKNIDVVGDILAGKPNYASKISGFTLEDCKLPAGSDNTLTVETAYMHDNPEYWPDITVEQFHQIINYDGNVIIKATYKDTYDNTITDYYPVIVKVPRYFTICLPNYKFPRFADYVYDGFYVSIETWGRDRDGPGIYINHYIYSYGQYAGSKLGTMYFGWTMKDYDTTNNQWNSHPINSSEWPRYPVYTFAPSLDWQDIDTMRRNNELSPHMLYTYWISNSALLTFILDSQTDGFIQLWNTTNLKENDIISKIEVPGSGDYTEGQGYNLKVTTHSNNETVIKLPIPKYTLSVTFAHSAIASETPVLAGGIFTIEIPAFSKTDELIGSNDQEYFLALTNKLNALGATSTYPYPLTSSSTPLARNGSIQLASECYENNGELFVKVANMSNGIGGTATNITGFSDIQINMLNFRMINQTVKER